MVGVLMPDAGAEPSWHQFNSRFPSLVSSNSNVSHVSAFGGKADTRFAACPLFRSLLGVKRTSLIAAHMSASDPKRTSGLVATYFFSGLMV
jgi:hypothetical protein